MPGWVDKTSARLSISNGCQDHTTSPYASASLVLRVCRSLTGFHPPCDPVSRATLPRPPHPVPNVRDDSRSAPLAGRDARTINVIWVNREAIYFWQEGWTGILGNCPSGKSLREKTREATATQPLSYLSPCGEGGAKRRVGRYTHGAIQVTPTRPAVRFALIGPPSPRFAGRDEKSEYIARLWLEADGKALAIALSDGIIQEVGNGKEEKG